MDTVVLLFVLIGIVLLDIVAILHGFDSRDKLESPEWERRRWWGMSL